ncbi:MAG: NAD(P)-binding protein, partial [Candidatus Diapherotrites archaeon]|nr:NAD(P)-binding protein [Candidatus Diapherotrites archaeon]
MNLIAGAGPAGLLCAKEAAAEGARITVWEQHHEVGSPAQCTGLISKSGLDTLGVEYEEAVLNEARGARFFSPSGEAFEVKKQRTVALIVDRTALDQTIAE